MVKIAVFDSGLGSLSVIKPIQKKISAEIIYFADQKNYPYGIKTVDQLDKIIKTTILKLQEKFDPDVIVVGSNTPSLLLDIEKKDKIIGVFPPLKEAASKTKSGKIGMLVTKTVVKNKILDKYIRKNIPSRIHVTKINATLLVDLVESGKFISQKQASRNIIKKIISPYVENNVDVFTLSSTHLPFLLPILKELFPDVVFLDPADTVAQHISKVLKHRSEKPRLKIYSSGDIETFHKKLVMIGIKNKVKQL
ncbi:MAG: aspartate/glutamate racemase family protein [Thaumarchaeota archaeon]|nr:aspartate/glutamate racemase family protein [Nitrososphaerota archaeon]MDE1831540.1 aspartate/glutamate racemase family protein [Nitrososphaerota archaeon]MDE1841256.1 aspartate/glutamate racemase family protein [Nitrososphaerota archaeon]MDE1877631.1 aspartate/glutamate racemase family protein [Nitrososphaerota archaeon]